MQIDMEELKKENESLKSYILELEEQNKELLWTQNTNAD